MSLTQRQVEMRRTGITATDARVLSGLDPYGRTPHDIWRSKVLGEEDVRESEAMSLGQELEPLIVPRVARKVGRHVLRMDPSEMTIRSKTHERELATPDAFLAATAFHVPDSIAQVKVCGLQTAGAWGPVKDGPDGIPEHVLIQCAWELNVTDFDVEYVGALIGTEVRVYTLEHTQAIRELTEALREVADRFWTDHVVTKRPPAVDGSEGSARMLRALFPAVSGPVVRATDEVELLAHQFFERRREVEEAEGRLEQTRQLMQTACGSASGIVGEGWRLKYDMREAYEVTPKPYRVEAKRVFDLRRLDSRRPAKRERAA